MLDTILDVLAFLTSPGLAAYTLVLVVGLGLFVLTFVVDGLLDFLDGVLDGVLGAFGLDVGGGSGWSLFSGQLLSFLLVGIGGAGVVYTSMTDWSAFRVFVTAGLTGFGIQVATYLLVSRLFIGNQASSASNAQSAVGRTGKVTLTIPAGGTGTVAYHHAGVYTRRPARVREVSVEVRRGEPVRVVDVQGDTLVVEKLEV